MKTTPGILHHHRQLLFKLRHYWLTYLYSFNMCPIYLLRVFINPLNDHDPSITIHCISEYRHIFLHRTVLIILAIYFFSFASHFTLIHYRFADCSGWRLLASQLWKRLLRRATILVTYLEEQRCSKYQYIYFQCRNKYIILIISNCNSNTRTCVKFRQNTISLQSKSGLACS